VVDLSDVDTAADQVIAGGLDVVDGNLQALQGAGLGLDEALPE
jgi:hypothetical protein